MQQLGDQSKQQKVNTATARGDSEKVPPRFIIIKGGDNMSTSSEYRIVLDLHETDSQANINITQYDTDRVFYFIISDDGKPFDLSGCFCELKAKKPDGTILYNNCTVANNMITYQLTAATSAAVGIVECELIIQRAGVSTVDIPRVATPRFTISVNESVYNDGEITSTDEFNALVLALAEVVGLEGRTNAAMAEAQSLSASANESIARANEALNAANNINVWAGTNGNNAFIRVRRKDGMLQTLMIPGGSVIEYDEGSYDYSTIPSSENPDESASWSDVNQVINIAINNLKSNYANQVQSGNQNAVTSDAVYKYISEQLSSVVLPDLTEQQIQSLVNNSINSKISQLKSGYLDEVEAGSSEAVKSSAIVNYVSSIIGLLSEDMQRYVSEQIAAITDGDEVGW